MAARRARAAGGEAADHRVPHSVVARSVREPQRSVPPGPKGVSVISMRRVSGTPHRKFLRFDSVIGIARVLSSRQRHQSKNGESR